MLNTEAQILARIKETRALMKAHKAEVRARMAVIERHESSDMRNSIANDLQTLQREYKYSVAKLGRAYGSSDRNTILAVLEQEVPTSVVKGESSLRIEPREDNFLITVDNYTDWSVPDNAGVSHTGSLLVRKTSTGNPVPLNPVPAAEQGKPLHNEVVRGKPDSMLMVEWANVVK